VISIVLNIPEMRRKIKQLNATDMWVNERDEMSNKIPSYYACEIKLAKYFS
jgi:hypothetical protein